MNALSPGAVDMPSLLRERFPQAASALASLEARKAARKAAGTASSPSPPLATASSPPIPAPLATASSPSLPAIPPGYTLFDPQQTANLEELLNRMGAPGAQVGNVGTILAAAAAAPRYAAAAAAMVHGEAEYREWRRLQASGHHSEARNYSITHRPALTAYARTVEQPAPPTSANAAIYAEWQRLKQSDPSAARAYSRAHYKELTAYARSQADEFED